MTMKVDPVIAAKLCSNLKYADIAKTWNVEIRIQHKCTNRRQNQIKAWISHYSGSGSPEQQHIQVVLPFNSPNWVC